MMFVPRKSSAYNEQIREQVACLHEALPVKEKCLQIWVYLISIVKTFINDGFKELINNRGKV